MGELFCPRCGAVEHYRLGDGRRMCRCCRQKYTGNPPRKRIEAAALKRLAAAFAAGRSAEQAARSSQVNRKTAQQYYRRLRGLLAEDSRYRRDLLLRVVAQKRVPSSTWQELLNRLPRVGSKLVVAPLNARVLTLFADEYAELSRGYSARPGLVVAWTPWLPPGWNDTTLLAIEADNFWQYAQRQLAVYRGGSGDNYRLFVKEMEFRYNHRNRAELEWLLAHIINKT